MLGPHAFWMLIGAVTQSHVQAANTGWDGRATCDAFLLTNTSGPASGCVRCRPILPIPFDDGTLTACHKDSCACVQCGLTS